MHGSTIVLIIFVAICYFLYRAHVNQKEEEEERKREIERERHRKEYEIKQKEIVKETKSYQRRPDDWQMRKDYVMRRDGYKCTVCGGTTSLQVHHKNPVSNGPDHSENNLVTLCIHCHSKQEARGHTTLIVMSVGSQCSKYFFKQVKCRKEYICSCCEETIPIGSNSYKKDYFSGNSQYYDKKIPYRSIRVCEHCLLNFDKYRDNRMRSMKDIGPHQVD